MWFISFMLTIGLSAGRNKHSKLITQAAAKAAPQQETITTQPQHWGKYQAPRAVYQSSRFMLRWQKSGILISVQYGQKQLFIVPSTFVDVIKIKKA